MVYLKQLKECKRNARKRKYEDEEMQDCDSRYWEDNKDSSDPDNNTLEGGFYKFTPLINVKIIYYILHI